MKVPPAGARPSGNEGKEVRAISSFPSPPADPPPSQHGVLALSDEFETLPPSYGNSERARERERERGGGLWWPGEPRLAWANFWVWLAPGDQRARGLSMRREHAGTGWSSAAGGSRAPASSGYEYLLGLGCGRWALPLGKGCIQIPGQISWHMDRPDRQKERIKKRISVLTS